MPYTITTGLSACNGYAVVKDDDNEIMGCHKSELQAEQQMAALYAADDDMEDVEENHDDSTDDMTIKTPNRQIAEEILASVLHAD
jgi:hypothetical protein